MSSSEEPQIFRLPRGRDIHTALADLAPKLHEPLTAPLFLVCESAGPKDEYLRALLGVESSSAALLATGGGPLPLVQRGVVVDVDVDVTDTAEADHSASIIALRLDPSDYPALQRALDALETWKKGREVPKFSVGLLAFALVRTGVSLSAVDAYPWTSEEQISALDLRWQRAARGQDGLVSTLALRPVSRWTSRLAVRLGVSPNALTLLSVLLALTAAVLLAGGGQFGTAGAVVLMYVALVLDCSDGEVARFTGKATAVGGWLDGFTDRIKEHGLLIGLAFGAANLGADAWLVASVAVAVITARHIANFAFIETVATPQKIAPRARGFDEPVDYSEATSNWKQRPGLAQTTPRGWISRVLHAPVSERWAVLGVLALAGDARCALLGYASYVGLSLLLTTAGWIVRTRRLPRTLDAGIRADLVVIRDGYRQSRRGGRWSWLLAPATVVIEFGSALAIAWSVPENADVTGVSVFLFIVAASWLRYERAYGLQYGGARTVARLGGGWASRTGLALGLVALLQFEIAVPVRAILTAGTGWLLILVTAAAVATHADLKRMKEAGR